MATNGGNLPALIEYKKIKDVTIFKLPGSMKSGSFNSAFGIRFTEIKEKEVIIRGFFRNKTKIETTEEEKIVPFSFKTLEIAKDFAQYLPGMKIWGERLYKNENNDLVTNKKQIMYETYLVKVPNINGVLAIKFMDDCEHPTHQEIKKKESSDGSKWVEYYINDLDKRYFDGSYGNWYNYSDLTVDYFFTTYDFDINLKKLISKDQFETIGDRQKFENETTHHFILMEQ